MTIPTFEEIIGHNDQIAARAEHLEKLKALIGNAYPNKFERSNITGGEDTISNIHDFAPVTEIVQELKDNTPEGEKPNQELKESLNEKLKAFGNVRVAGRLAVPPRVMGKAAFVHLSDGKERLQIYVRKQDASVINNDTGEKVAGEEAAWEVFKLLDHGDFIGADGYLFLTNTGELSVHVETFQFLAKALLPMPDKVHGIADPELQRRYRYADLIADSLKIEHEAMPTREVFERRARLISGMRNYLDAHGYIEVETPMLTPKATGAAAKPFKTHHNALDIELYARIAPELYLKRLVVGGFEKVYELNRNFRNEGLSQRHNPEFTMLEFYCAYMDVNGMMDFAEMMIQEAVKRANNGSLIVKYGVNEIDFSKFERLSMERAIIKELKAKSSTIANDLSDNFFNELENLIIVREFANAAMHININQAFPNLAKSHKELEEEYIQSWRNAIEHVKHYSDENKRRLNKVNLLVDTFEELVENNLIQPTFIIDYPKSISPLSKASPENPQIAERFELFVNGMEIANGFSELNNPGEQRDRFADQMSERERGDEEAMVMDEDYIRALAYGMPPAAGIGIGIDRLVMLLTNRHSIRDVILFPHLRPERKDEGEGKSERD